MGQPGGVNELGRQRKVLLNQLRVYPQGGREAVEATVGLLTSSQVIALSRFIEEGGWARELNEAAITMLKGVLAARQRVSGVYAGGDAPSPIREPVQVAPIPQRSEPPSRVAPVVSAQPAFPRQPLLTRRAPLAPSKVDIQRPVGGRTAEGRRRL